MEMQNKCQICRLLVNWDHSNYMFGSVHSVYEETLDNIVCFDC